MLRASLLFVLLSALFSSVLSQTTPSTCSRVGVVLNACFQTAAEGADGTTNYITETPRLFYYSDGTICGVDGGLNIQASNVATAPTGFYTITGIFTGSVQGVLAANRINTTTSGSGMTAIQTDTFNVGFTVAMTTGGVTTTGNAVLIASNVQNNHYTDNPAGSSFTFSLEPGTMPLSSILVGACKPTVRTVGDPQFVGMRGQSYQVHGVDGSVYNIISDKNLQVNSKFVFLLSGQCPMFDGVADTNCWSHPGSYMGEMSFQSVVAGKLHAALLTSGSAKQGFSMIQMDGKVVKVGEQVQFGSFQLTAVTSHKVVIATEQFTFELTNSDSFINQALTPKVPLSKMTAHGLLGQTHQAKTYSNSIKFIEGEVDDYVIADNDIFGDDFVYNQFKA